MKKSILKVAKGLSHVGRGPAVIIAVIALPISGLAGSLTNCFAYPNFAAPSGLSLVGTAATVGGVLRLTPAASGGQIGNAWRDKEALAAAIMFAQQRLALVARREDLTELGHLVEEEGVVEREEHLHLLQL